MYSPVQEVPSTPSLRTRPFYHAYTAESNTPEAIVPDNFVDQTQESFSVPGTPRAPTPVSPLPWTPRSRSHVRSATFSATRRYVYQPSLLFRSPAVAASPKEQIVPGTPQGAFVPPNTTPTRRGGYGGLGTPNSPYAPNSPFLRQRTPGTRPISNLALNYQSPATVSSVNQARPRSSLANQVNNPIHAVDATGDHAPNVNKRTQSNKRVTPPRTPLSRRGDSSAGGAGSSTSRRTTRSQSRDWLDNI